ncbi:MFS transporter [Streptomyces sp. NPDC056500]|uniref:MFS transporter n=1 Tax=Streptomyces sp. NPDC056500 TaxID=3345840 RepID=UPI0036A37D05
MPSTSSDPRPAREPAVSPADPPPGKLPSASLGGLGPLLTVVSFSWIFPVVASITLIQAQLEDMDNSSKIFRFALLSGTGALVGMFANIVFGAWSDRTRSRFGRRNPWIVGGGAVAAVSLSALSFVHSFPAMMVCYLLFQASLNAFLAPWTAVIPDRVARSNLGKASTCVGLGQLLGQSLGGVAAGAFLASPSTGLRWLPAVLLVGVLFFAVRAPDRPNSDTPREPLSVRRLAKLMMPPKDADFGWALAGRLLTMLGFQCAMVYQLFLLTDHIGIDEGDTGRIVSAGGIVVALTSAAAVALAGPLSDRLGRRRVFVAGAGLLIAVAMIPLAVFPQLWAFFALLAVSGFGFGAYVAVDQALMAEVLPNQENSAKDLGILNVANTVPQVLAPVLAGVALPLVGYPGLLVLAVGISVLGALCIAPIRRVR